MLFPSFRIIVVVAVLATLALGASSVAQADRSSTSANVRDENAIEAPLVSKINATRRARRLAPLRRSPALARAARSHAYAMGEHGFFGHSSSDGTAPATRIRRYYRGSVVGETLLWRSPDVSAAEALRMWLESPPHRALLLSKSFREIGVAAVQVERAGGDFGNRPATIVVADFGAR